MNIQFLLFTVLIAIANTLLPKEANLLIICLLIFFISPFDANNIYKSCIKVIWPFIILLIIGILIGLSELQNVNRDFIRDLFFVSKVIIYFISGLLLSKYIKDIGTFFKYFILYVFIESVLHISRIILNFGAFESLDQYRKVTGNDNIVEAILLSLFISALLHKKFGTLIGKLSFLTKVQVFVISVSFVCYFSRTMLINLVILTIFLVNGLNIRNNFLKSSKRFVFPTTLIILCLLLVGSILSLESSNILLDSLIEKFERIPNEIFWSSEKNSFASFSDINENFRGYEAYQGILKFEQGSCIQKLFGFGFGALVDLDISIKLANQDYENVPILHNGYIMILVKCGILGLILYLLFIYNVGFTRVYHNIGINSENYYLYQTLSGLCMITLVNTFTITGLLNPANVIIPILFGLFWGNIQRNKMKITS